MLANSASLRGELFLVSYQVLLRQSKEQAWSPFIGGYNDVPWGREDKRH